MTEELDGCGHNDVVRNGKQGGLRVHRNVPYEFCDHVVSLGCSRHVFCLAY